MADLTISEYKVSLLIAKGEVKALEINLLEADKRTVEAGKRTTNNLWWFVFSLALVGVFSIASNAVGPVIDNYYKTEVTAK